MIAYGPRPGSVRRPTPIAVQNGIRDALDAGASPTELARTFGVSVRTIYRYAADARGGRLALVELNGYRALFRLGHGRAPAQLSRWELAR